MSRDHVLVTGGAGFIGSHLVDRLLDRGFEVTVLDCLLPQVHGDAEVDDEGWPTYLDRRANRIKADILDDGVMETALPGVTHLVHLAASVGVGQSMTNIVDYTRNNTLAAAVILEALARCDHEVRRMAVASSMSIYGEGEYYDPRTGRRVAPHARDHEDLRHHQWELFKQGRALKPMPTSEEKPLGPNSVYAVNKRDHEELFLAVGRALDIPTVALRMFNAYGSRQALSNPYTGVAAIFIARLLNDEPPLVFEDGEQRRDFVHVLDVADAFVAALDSEEPIWDVFNVGSGEPVTINQIARTLARLLHKNISPEILNKHRVGDVRHCFADIGKIERELGFRPRHRFEEGMKELIEWVQTARKPVDRAQASLAELESSRMVV